jgi:hypothetical protein
MNRELVVGGQRIRDYRNRDAPLLKLTEPLDAALRAAL